MKVKKRRSLFLVATICFLGVGAAIFSNLNPINTVYGDNISYEMTFNSSKNKFHNYTDNIYYTGEAAVKTNLNNNIIFEYKDLMGLSNTWHIVKVGGYFTNLDPLNGLEKININFTSDNVDYKIYWSYTTTFDETNVFVGTSSRSSSLNFDFCGSYPAYFKFENISQNNLDIFDVNLEFNCLSNEASHAVSVINYNDNYVTVDGEGYYHYGETVKLFADFDSGEFIGWYLDNQLLSTKNPYSFKMIYNSMQLEARWHNLTISNNVVKSCPKDIKCIYFPDNVTSIERYAFQRCTSLTSATIPDSVTSIGNGAFNGCTSLTSLTIGSGVTSISYATFSDCTSLTSITISDSVTSIGEYAFRDCTSLTSIVIPDSVTSIGYSAFKNCTSLTSITLPFIGGSVKQQNSYTYFGRIFGAIGYSENKKYVPSKLKEIIISDSDTPISIGAYAFFECYYLTSLTIGNNVTSIGKYAFSDCTSLTSLTIGKNVPSISPELPFYNCSLTNVYYKGTIEDWCRNSFPYGGSNPMHCTEHFYVLNELNEWYEVTEIVTLTLNTVTEIGAYAFIGCTSFTSIIIPQSVTSIGHCAFYRCTSLTNVYYKGTIEDWCRIYFDDEYSNPMYYAEHFYMLNEFNEWYEVTEIIVPDTVTEIDYYQFCGFENATSITIPDSITSIGGYAFEGCTSLTSITIPDSVTSIGYRAFKGCTSLTSITIPDSVTSIDGRAFEGCTSLTIYCEAESQQSGWNSIWNYSDRPVYWAGDWEYDVNGNPYPLI